MSRPIRPESFSLVLMAFQGCFHAPSYANFQWLVAGWVRCAGRRAAPFGFLVYDLVLLWFAEQAQTTTAPVWPARPWYRSKTAPSFLDMLETLRRAGWQTAFSESPSPTRRLEKSSLAPPHRQRKAA